MYLVDLDLDPITPVENVSWRVFNGPILDLNLYFSECSTAVSNCNTETQIEMRSRTVEHFPEMTFSHCLEREFMILSLIT